MTCYRINWKLSEAALEPIMRWLDDHREEVGLLRSQAFGQRELPKIRRSLESAEAAPLQTDNVFVFADPVRTVWYTKFVFKDEDGLRLFCRQWMPDYVEKMQFTPWGR